MIKFKSVAMLLFDLNQEISHQLFGDFLILSALK